MQCSFCANTDQEITMVQGISEKTFICENCIDLFYTVVVKNGIKKQSDLPQNKKSNEDFSEYNTEELNVQLIEFFLLDSEPSESKGDWGSEFAVWNYFVPEVSIRSYNDKIFVASNNVFYTKEDLQKFLEVELTGKVYFNGDPLPGNVIEGLIRTAISGENDVDEVIEYFPESEIEIIEGIDDISADYANNFGCRIWSFDVPGGKLSVNNSGYKIDLSGTEYSDLDDFISAHEDQAIKSIAIVRAYFS